jgi:hypothetical protein
MIQQQVTNLIAKRSASGGERNERLFRKARGSRSFVVIHSGSQSAIPSVTQVEFHLLELSRFELQAFALPTASNTLKNHAGLYEVPRESALESRLILGDSRVLNHL